MKKEISDVSDERDRPKFARYYFVARTVHLERLRSYAPGRFYYSHVRADFDQSLADSLPYVERRNALQVARSVIKHRVDILEVPEPLAIRVWPQALLIHTAVTLANLFRRRKTRLVSYAIENYAPDLKLAHYLHIPTALARPIVSLVAGYLVATSSRIVFGTEDARTTYENLLGRRLSRDSLHTDLIWALPSPLDGIDDRLRPKRVVFLGTFERRKGIFELMSAWPKVRELDPGISLLLLGKAGEIERVRDFAGSFEEVTLIEDPERSTIFEELKASKALVLFSQPSGIWKEQVGLPILEALSSGCEIVSSDETGIAYWLESNGHQVLPWNADGDVLAHSVVLAVHSSRTPTEILDSLPREDSRAVADTELFRV